MAFINRILSLTQSDLPAPQETTRQSGDYLENPEILKQVQHDNVKEYQCQKMIYKLYKLIEEEIKIVEGFQ